YSNPYGQWARGGEGKTDEDKDALKWMHAGADDDTDGWYLARFDHPDGGRSYTGCSGIRIDEMLAGGRSKMPPLKDILATYKPQAVVLMLGTNDASAGRSVAGYKADMEKAVDLILDQGAVCILSTIPPHPGKLELSKAYNEELRKLAKDRGLPLIDYEQEILKRRPDDWNGTLIGKNDVHPTAEQGGATAHSAPTAENLRNCGYLLRGWLSVEKIAEVKKTVFDAVGQDSNPVKPGGQDRNPVPPPAGEAVKAPVTRDTWFSNVGPEAAGNNGGADRLKVKSNQEMSLIDIDPAPLQGRVILGATLHLHLAAEPILYRLTVGTFGAPWVEGTSSGYAPQKGSSCHNWRQYPDVPWTVPGSDLCSVMLGVGGTTWRMADASPPDKDGWQTVAVDPSIVADRIAGVSYGFLLFDDTGSEWKREGDKFTLIHMPNRFVHSREAGPARAPYLTVYLGAEDKAPPAAPTALRGDAADLPPGETWLSWVTPKDDGPAGTVGFFVTIDGKEVPRYLIPLAGKPGERVRMHLRDQNLGPGVEVKVAVKAVDGAGNVGPAAEATVNVSDRRPEPLPGQAPKPFKASGSLPKLGDAEVAIIDELDKVQPVTGEMIPKQPNGYLAANHLWSAKTLEVNLYASRNEFVSFQVLFHGAVKGVQPILDFADKNGPPVTFSRYRTIPDTRKGPLPDPIVPLGDGLTVPSADDSAGTKYGSLHVEVYIPHGMPPGEHKGKLLLKAGAETLPFDVTLHVWNFTLPDYLSFIPEMNCYGLPANERDYYRLAHVHRVVLNKVPYYHSGNVEDGCASVLVGGRGGVTPPLLDWTAWDKRFGPYFDGSAFADLPRKGVPMECFYLPLFENWPTPMEGNYNGDYWADRAFPESYRKNFVEVSRQFAEHIRSKHWDDTLFQCFFNGKNNFKQNGWSRGTCPWLLDEPSNFQDYWALRWFGAAWQEGINEAPPGKAKLAFRCDISRPQWQRDALDGVLDYNVCGGAMRQYQRIVMDRKEANGEIVVEYAGSNALEDSNMQPLGWSLDAWSRGADGVLPWQTIGSDESWKKADELSLFYPSRDAREGPIPSIRLKAYRRGEQDVEYLTLFAQATGQPRWAVGETVRQALHLAGERKTAGGEDAGVVNFAQLKPQDVWALRVQVGAALSDAAPPAKRRLIDLRTPPRDPDHLPPAYVSFGRTP
ncbi:MAG TPA: GDSL-type esterase/lipase family protein, partial [Gemmataceae bacterium]|nr:GDSL-type esterase/lipase family protein [Gemmataceae bacterium]